MVTVPATKVDGEIEGDVGEAEVIIGERGKVTGTAAAQRVIVARHHLRCHSWGYCDLAVHVEGDIHHMSLAIEQGIVCDYRALKHGIECSARAAKSSRPRSLTVVPQIAGESRVGLRRLPERSDPENWGLGTTAPRPLGRAVPCDLFKLMRDTGELVLRRHPFCIGIVKERDPRDKLRVVLARGPPSPDIKVAAQRVGHGRHGHQAEHGYAYERPHGCRP